jgi:hypothetical protein
MKNVRFLNTGLLNAVVVAGVTGLAGAAGAATIISPGQCITVGGTEVCASMPTSDQCDQLRSQSASESIFSCRYDSRP